MVCTYCQAETTVINSRLHKRANEVWRRRRCLSCHAVFTTYEAADYAQSISVQTSDGAYQPFVRDKLFLSIYHSCQHRPQAQADASALTDTVISQMQRNLIHGSISTKALTTMIRATLGHFDQAAAVHYAAFHSEA